MINLRPKVPKFAKASKRSSPRAFGASSQRGAASSSGQEAVSSRLGQKLSTVCKANVMGTVSSIAPCYDDAGA